MTPIASGVGDPAVAPLALLVGQHGLEQVAAAEVRPQSVGDVDLGIGDLPQQVVADAHLAARPNHQVGVGLAAGVEEARERRLVKLIGTQSRRHGAPRRVDDFRAAAVVQRDVEQHAARAGGSCDRLIQFLAHVARQFVGPADDVEPDVVAEQHVQFRTQIALQQQHQRPDFGGRPLPVLHRERVQRQDLEAEAGRRLDGVADGVDARPMTFDARQMPLRGPAAVAVHDDGDVRGQTIEMRPGAPAPRRGAPRNPRQDVVKRHGAVLVDARASIIVHPDEEQPLGRGGCARLFTPARSQQFRDRRRLAPAAANLDQRAHDRRAPCGAGIRRRAPRRPAARRAVSIECNMSPPQPAHQAHVRLANGPDRPTNRCRDYGTRRSRACPRTAGPPSCIASRSSGCGTCHTNARSKGLASGALRIRYRYVFARASNRA